MPKTKAEDRIAYHLGRQGFDMFYALRTPYSETRATLEAAMEKGGNNTEYIVLDPYARVVVHQFTNDLMTKEEARVAYAKLIEIADHNVANNAKYGKSYGTAKESVEAIFAQIENQIFDCAYFVEKLRPQYDADPDNPEVFYNLAVSNAEIGETEKAIEYYNEVLALDPNFQNVQSRINSLKTQKN